jgi:hypothetical protein
MDKRYTTRPTPQRLCDVVLNVFFPGNNNVQISIPFKLILKEKFRDDLQSGKITKDDLDTDMVSFGRLEDVISTKLAKRGSGIVYTPGKSELWTDVNPTRIWDDDDLGAAVQYQHSYQQDAIVVELRQSPDDTGTPSPKGFYLSIKYRKYVH